MSRTPLADWYAAIGRALTDGEVKAVPVLLVSMASDGYGHEAEDLRRRLLAVARGAERDLADGSDR